MISLHYDLRVIHGIYLSIGTASSICACRGRLALALARNIPLYSTCKSLHRKTASNRLEPTIAWVRRHRSHQCLHTLSYDYWTASHLAQPQLSRRRGTLCPGSGCKNQITCTVELIACFTSHATTVYHLLAFPEPSRIQLPTP